MDRVLTRKMRLRSGPGYSPISLERLEAGARRLIARNIGEDFTLSRVRWLTGGASKIQVAFDIEWNGPAGDRRSEEHTSELQSLMRNSYAVFCLKKKKNK